MDHQPAIPRLPIPHKMSILITPKDGETVGGGGIRLPISGDSLTWLSRWARKSRTGLGRLFPPSVESVKPPKRNRPFPQTSGYTDCARTAPHAEQNKSLGSDNPSGCKTSSGFAGQELANVFRCLELPKSKIRVNRGFEAASKYPLTDGLIPHISLELTCRFSENHRFWQN
jgi:hypothetical protein